MKKKILNIVRAIFIVLLLIEMFLFLKTLLQMGDTDKYFRGLGELIYLFYVVPFFVFQCELFRLIVSFIERRKLRVIIFNVVAFLFVFIGCALLLLASYTDVLKYIYLQRQWIEIVVLLFFALYFIARCASMIDWLGEENEK